MDEELIRRVMEEVMRRIRQASDETTADSAPATPRSSVMAIFTGGTIGREEGLAALKELQEDACHLTVVLSRAAETIIGAERVRQHLGEDVTIVTPDSPYPGKALRQADLVIVPVLTQNTMAKLAHTLSDTLPTTLIMQALMLGKPVIAAENAADPRDSWRAGLEMDKAPIVLVRAFQENLRKVRDFGVNLTDVRNLGREARRALERSHAGGREAAAPQAAAPAKKNLVDAEKIKAVALSGGRVYTVAPGDLITPLARDTARDYGVEIIRANT
ncbi:flavoprotein [Heliomicrobium undosum]|nr:flavoprotein [Heliomicrobium undosum]